MLCLSYYCLCLLFCLEEEGLGEKGGVWGQRGRNDPNNVCAYEYTNKEKI
jgi:hypothetical protein